MAMEDGRAVYRALPPGVALMPARASLAQFPSDSGARLVAHVEVPGGPADMLWGSWVVAAADGRAVARGDRALTLSACDPGEKRIVQFDAAVPPGDYQVHLSVDDHRGRRGIVRLTSRVEPAADRLAMSELVLLCGPPAAAAAGAPVLLEPSLDRRVGGARAVAVYFEMDGLAPGPEGRSRFEYRYALRRFDPDARAGRAVDAVLQASREEENVGPHRRQFVSVPIPSLARGSYDLVIEVRDLESGGTATRSVRLVKD
jgi:hypothetical protein